MGASASRKSDPQPIHIRLRSALLAGHQVQTMIELTLKVKLTAQQLAALVRWLVVLAAYLA
ncbi:hypothetical protein APR50_32615 [Variovorax paradoxus]|jgi:hypothetical protein|nr:hypothetical protein APR52_13980 [Variovorax paradoxus]KPV00465.1 hypothetical protein APR50_32615 [Variovorax paradoxus]KPV08078.1 hypothetical protein APR49_16050 [Variovorax paradoxus]KPV22542.1 hypothetical protein APR51_10045 [Variovorax paradoxus]KPV35388.1 hypothetical protein APR48_04405 [Variovorax paradoxus]